MANNLFIDLLPPWVETGIQPAFYDKESGTVLQQTARMYAKVNELTTAYNSFTESINDTVDDYIERFNTLYDYVHDYFDNLDVQQEINHKLDSMYADGSLAQLISSYIQPRIDAQNESILALSNEVDTFETGVSAQIQGFNAMVASITSGSPLVASSTAGMTNTNRVYVNTTDGKWYYYNGSAWTAGGTYQSSGISSDSVTITMLGSDVKYNFITKDSVDREQYETTIELDLTGNLVNRAVAGGELGENSNIRVATTNLIYVPFGYCLTVLRNDDSYEVQEYDFADDFTNSDLHHRVDSGNNLSFINSNDARYVRLRFNKGDNTLSPSDVLANCVVGMIQRIPSKNHNTRGNNLANPYFAIEGYVQDQNSSYYYVPSASYLTYMPIKMSKGVKYHISNFRKFFMYDNNLRYIDNSYENGSNESKTFTAPSDGYFVVSARPSDNVMINSGDDALSYEAYVEVMPPYVQIQNVDNLSSIVVTGNDILSNKSYVALGDSFTHGDFSHAPQDDYHITSGRYSGQLKVYPYIIGNRTNMTITNLAQNGMTMCKISDDWTNYISDGVLAQIPENPDYITIKIGINDNPDHRNSPLGTINDSTNETFYGSYNRVMNYLISHFPNAKIGIIISNGQTSMDFINAEIAIAKKFGVPYLNETTDDQVPLLIRTMRTDVADSIKNARNNEWFVSTTSGSENKHPNAKCHVYESTIVENFLRRL